MIISLVSLSILAAHQDINMAHTIVAPGYAVLNYFTMVVFVEMILESVNFEIENVFWNY